MARHLDLAKFKRLLEDERTRVTAEIEDLQTQLESASGQGSEQGELSHYDEHQADVASETFARERDIALERNEEAILRQVEAALRKTDDGTYGTCERCGKPIATARLTAIPYAAFCIECASRLEGQS